ncbi:MAG: glycosyltransferase family 4 protein [Lachnospiraceae bacterium]|nr:glycosyltransferase family 4 protein [Lachnospiraceae bacterium]
MNKKKALVTASVASMIDLFNRDNIRILQELGYEVEIASNFAFGSITSQKRVDAFKQEMENKGIRVIHVPIPRSITDIKHIISSYKQMKKLIREEEYALVHTQSPIGGVVARLAAKKWRKKGTRVIYTAHGFHFFNGASKASWLLFYPIEKLLSKGTDVLITINAEDYERAKKFSAKRVCYVPGIGVDVDKFRKPTENREALRQEFGFAEEDFVLLSVGQLSKRKNQETMIRAMAQISDRNVKYLVVGLGEMEEADRKLIMELGLKDRVILAGYKDNVDELLHTADAFVFPSLQEGLPVSLMEAMAAGLPIIASKIRGNTDLITDGMEGMLVEAMDTTAYAKAVMELKADSSLQKSYRNCALEKIQGFSAACVHDRMKDIYQSIEK